MFSVVLGMEWGWGVVAVNTDLSVHKLRAVGRQEGPLTHIEKSQKAS